MAEDRDKQVLEIARTLFYEKGVENTEMKDIAARLGTSRSTLYRHFPDKNHILFRLAQEALETVDADVRAVRPDAQATGGQEFAARIRALNGSLLAHPRETQFLRDFDYLFTGSYPEGESESSFSRYVQAEQTNRVLLRCYLRGIQDGSICPSPDPKRDVAAICNSCFAMAQRILPRREHYLAEQGYAEELLYRHAELLLAAVLQP